MFEELRLLLVKTKQQHKPKNPKTKKQKHGEKGKGACDLYVSITFSDNFLTFGNTFLRGAVFCNSGSI